jgi:hypothetical protein
LISDKQDNNLIEEAMKLIYVEAEPDLDFKLNLCRWLVNEYSVRSLDMKRSNWKAILTFSLASLVTIGLIAYGLWLPTSLDFLQLF